MKCREAALSVKTSNDVSELAKNIPKLLANSSIVESLTVKARKTDYDVHGDYRPESH